MRQRWHLRNLAIGLLQLSCLGPLNGSFTLPPIQLQAVIRGGIGLCLHADEGSVLNLGRAMHLPHSFSGIG
jgi:hypothetical protein